MNDETTAAPQRGGNDDETRQMPAVPRSPWDTAQGAPAPGATTAVPAGPAVPADPAGPSGPAGPPPPPAGRAAEDRAGTWSPPAQQHAPHQAPQQTGWPQTAPAPSSTAWPPADAWQNPGWQQAGAPGWDGRPAHPARPGFLKALFDLSFRHSVTVGFAKVIYVLAIAVAVGAWVIALFTSLSALNDPWVGAAAGWGLVGTFVLGLPLTLLWIVLVRVGLEVTVATVRTADNTARLVELGEDRAAR